MYCNRLGQVVDVATAFRVHGNAPSDESRLAMREMSYLNPTARAGHAAYFRAGFGDTSKYHIHMVAAGVALAVAVAAILLSKI